MGNILTKRKYLKWRNSKKQRCPWCDNNVVPADNRISANLSGPTTTGEAIPLNRKWGTTTVEGTCQEHAHWATVVKSSPRSLNDLFSAASVRNLKNTGIHRNLSSTWKYTAHSEHDRPARSQIREDHPTEVQRKSAHDDLSMTGKIPEKGPKEGGWFASMPGAGTKYSRLARYIAAAVKRREKRGKTNCVNSNDDFSSGEDENESLVSIHNYQQPVCWENDGSIPNRKIQYQHVNSSKTNVFTGGNMILEDLSSDELEEHTTERSEGAKGATGPDGVPAALKQPVTTVQNGAASQLDRVGLPETAQRNEGEGSIFAQKEPKEDEAFVGGKQRQGKLNGGDLQSVKNKLGIGLSPEHPVKSSHLSHQRDGASPTPVDESWTEKVPSPLTDDNLKASYLLSEKNMTIVETLYDDNSSVDSKFKVRSAGSRNTRGKELERVTGSKAMDLTLTLRKPNLERSGCLPRMAEHVIPALIDRNIAAIPGNAAGLKATHPTAIQASSKENSQEADKNDKATGSSEPPKDDDPVEFEPDEAGGDIVCGRYSINRHPACTGWFVGHHTAVSVCLHAICAAAFKHAKEWDGNFLDSLIHSGTDYHGKLLRNTFHRKPGERADIPLEKHGKHLEMFSNHWFEMERAPRVFDGKVQHLDPELGPLADQLPLAISTALSGYFYTCLLTILDDYCNKLTCMNMACIRGYDCNYYLFVPHPTTSTGRYDLEKGRVSLRKFPSVETMCHFVKSNHTSEAYFVLKAIAFSKPTTFKCPKCIQEMIDKKDVTLCKPILTKLK